MTVRNGTAASAEIDAIARHLFDRWGEVDRDLISAVLALAVPAPYGSVGGVGQAKRRARRADEHGKPALFVSHSEWRWYGPALPEHCAAARAWVDARAGQHWLRTGR